MKKKLLSILLVVVMLSMAGCGSNNSADGSSEKAEKDEIVLDFPSWQATEPGFQEFWEAAIEEFESRHENVSINFYQVPVDSYSDTLTTLFASGQPPHITHLITRYFAQFQDMGWLEPINDRLEATDILNNWTDLQSALEVDDEYYGVLLLGNGYSMYYNEAMFEEAGLDIPTDEATFLKAAEALTQDTGGDGDPDIFGFGACQVTDTNFYNEASTFVVGMGGTWSEDGDLTSMTSDETIHALETYQSLFKNNYTPTGLKVEQKRQYFVEGKIAMIFDGPWVASLIDTASDDVKDNLKVAEMPFEYTPGSVSNSLHIPAEISDDEKELVWEFIKMITEDEFQQLYVEEVGSPSPNASIINDQILEEQPFMGQFIKDAENAKEIIPSGYEKVYGEFTQMTIDAVMQMVVDPYADVETTLETLKSDVENNLQ
ncbi:MAG: ABC transporter substrate-binding protein [Suipraeoptans sp.]